MSNYEQLTLRNAGYVSGPIQQAIRDCRVLIAGCGIGSTIAEAAVRIGFERFVLADADRVEPHNLNRQAYAAADVGALKAEALGRRLLAINPEAQVEVVPEFIDAENAARILRGCDLVFDTVDFLDLNGIASLHDQANAQGKPLISAVSAGWGAALMYFPPDPAEPALFRRIFGLPETGPVANASYVEHFSVLFQALAKRLSPEIVQAMARALTVMEDGTPCPAPHVSPGSYSVAALAVSCAVRVLAGESVTPAPDLILVDLLTELARPGLGVLEARLAGRPDWTCLSSRLARQPSWSSGRGARWTSSRSHPRNPDSSIGRGQGSATRRTAASGLDLLDLPPLYPRPVGHAGTGLEDDGLGGLQAAQEPKVMMVAIATMT